MIDVHLLRVFADETGRFGDNATIVLDEDRSISDSSRRDIAERLNDSYSTVETAFVNSVDRRDISIVHQQGEIDFAGVVALGAAWFFEELAGEPISSMTSRGGNIDVFSDDGVSWVRAGLDAMPPWNHVQMESALDVEAIDVADTAKWDHRMVWAWLDRDAGVVRARTFATDWDIPEAQGNGSGSMMLAAQLDRPIRIVHGDGCVIHARPAGGDHADIGGRVVQQDRVTIE